MSSVNQRLDTSRQPTSRFLVSASDPLEAARRYLSPALVDEAAWTRVLAVAREFPVFATFGFEMRLGEEEAAADFFIGVFRPEEERRILAGLHPTMDLAEPIRSHPGWKQVRTLVRDWIASRDPEWEGVGSLWLEFDTASTRSAEPAPLAYAPSIFVGPSRPGEHLGHPAALARRLAGRQRTPAALERVLATPAAVRTLQHVGTMLGRPGSALRLCLWPPDRQAVVPLLRELGWPGSLSAVAGLLEQVAAWGPRFTMVDIDIGESLGPKLGLEFSVLSGTGTGPAPSWPDFLDRLVAAGLCLPHKRDGLLAWSGAHRVHLVWPRTYLRIPSHVKVVYQDGRPLEAKAYMYLQEVRRTPSPID